MVDLSIVMLNYQRVSRLSSGPSGNQTRQWNIPHFMTVAFALRCQRLNWRISSLLGCATNKITCTRRVPRQLSHRKNRIERSWKQMENYRTLQFLNMSKISQAKFQVSRSWMTYPQTKLLMKIIGSIMMYWFCSPIYHIVGSWYCYWQG